MLLEPKEFDLNELTERAGVSPRTVRYYIQQGLLPSPESRGPGARYGPEHLDRLRLIKQLQRRHLPLAEIRRQLEELGPEEVRALLRRAPAEPSSARDYVRSVLGRRSVDEHTVAMAPTAKPHGLGSVRSQWERVSLSADVELHVRRPLTREQNRQVERLIEAARTIFEDNEP